MRNNKIIPSIMDISSKDNKSQNVTVLSNKKTKLKKQWIPANINKRICIRYVQKVGKSDQAVCECGYNKDAHHYDHTKRHTTIIRSRATSIAPSSAVGGRGDQSAWDVNSDTSVEPTDAYGKIEFSGTGQKICDFVRADHLTPDKIIHKLLVDHWKLELPSLLISVTGGAQNFTMKRKLKEVFNKGLIKAALSTDAWIITGGTDAGVMKYVGEAVGTHLKAQGRGSRVVTIGVATWGIVMGKKDLIKEEGSWPINYRGEPDGTGKPQSALEPNHSHFILVDDGSEHKFGGEIGLRSRLESYISRNVENYEPIATVSVVLEGGPNTIKTVRGSIMADIPAVIVEGSGRAADILAYAYFNTQADSPNTAVWNEVGNMLTLEFRNDVDELLAYCKECIEKKDYMTVFRLDDENNKDNEIDVAILNALMKAPSKLGNIGKSLESQLKLAITWNRLDIARNLLASQEEKDIEDECLENLMEYSILRNRVEFVKLLMDMHSKFDYFFTQDRIVNFYKMTPENTYLYQLLMHFIKIHKIYSIKDLTVIDINCFVMTHIWSNMEDQDTYTEQCERDSKDWLIQLFFWCVFQNKVTLATLFWEEGKEGIATALAAYKIIQSIDEKNKDPELHVELMRHMDYFQSLALGVLSISYEEDETKTQLLLTKRMPNFGNSTTVMLAIEADNKMFIAHAACQRLFTKIWNGKMEPDNSHLKMVVSLMTWPFLVPLLIRFQRDDCTIYDTTDDYDLEKSTVSFTNYKDPENVTIYTKLETSHSEEMLKSQAEANRLCITEMLCSFLNAPVIIFTSNCIAYICLLILFSIIMLTDFHENVSKKEMLLIFWVATFIVEELRQACTMKFCEYIEDMWNVLDIIIMSVFVIGMSLRFVDTVQCVDCLNYARVVLSLDLMFFYLRTLHIFSVHRQLGPKMVMIKHMIIDMSFFVVILLVFVVAYGVSLQAILYPNAELNFSLLSSIFKKAYFQIYGELFLDELEGTLACDAVLTVNSTLPLCPINTKFLPSTLLAIYILFTNVLMLNLVIAMFRYPKLNYTFTKIQENTDQHWFFQRYFLIKEYHDRPPLAPPFIILWQMYAMIRITLRCCGFYYQPELKTDFAIDIYGDELIIWENMRADEYIRQSNIVSRASLEHRVKATHDRVEIISQRFDELTDSRASNEGGGGGGGGPPSNSSVDKRLSEIEKQIGRMITSLDTVKNILQK